MNEYYYGTEKYCVYGSEHIKDTVYIYGNWYCVDGSVNVNHAYCQSQFEDCKVTPDWVDDDRKYRGKIGYIDIEMIDDNDTATASEPINSLDELIAFVDRDEDEDEDH